MSEANHKLRSSAGMTKTPEQMAEEYVAHNRSYPYDPLNAQDRYMRNSYLAGYQAAKQHYTGRDKPETLQDYALNFARNKAEKFYQGYIRGKR